MNSSSKDRVETQSGVIDKDQNNRADSDGNSPLVKLKWLIILHPVRFNHLFLHILPRTTQYLGLECPAVAVSLTSILSSKGMVS